MKKVKQKEDSMKCPHLITWIIESCKADCRPYVPSLLELEGYCKSEAHGKCSFFQRDLNASSNAGDYVPA
ncbi:MAG: hypothetical protein HZB62_03695 [Nitrospirae bacterium]|nr:hypothetical protein [Nitrospirota bacterium]